MERYFTRWLFLWVSVTFLATPLTSTSLPLNQGKEVFEKKIHLDVTNVPLERVLQRLESLTSLKFVYSSDQVDVTSLVTVHATPKKFGAILTELFKDRGIQYSLNETGTFILLSKSVTQRTPGKEEADLEFQITGTVVDKLNAPLAGVNVLVKGTLTGTTTDGDGRYALMVNLNDVLVFSFIGFETQEVIVKGEGVVDVQLAENITNLDNVLVIGYGTTTRKLNTGNVSKLAAEDIQTRPVANPLQAMQGMMPGVFITQKTGVPGGGFDVLIRGTNSLRQDANDPLYIIDGVPFSSTPLSSPSAGGSIIANSSPLNNINPSDIASIEVLKDADATAIYGSRGANGVVLITTKKGAIGGTKFEVNGYQGWGEATRRIPLLNTQEYVMVRKEALQNDGVPINASAYDLMAWDTTRYTDWQEELIGNTAQITNLQLSVSAGNEQTQFLTQGRYYKESTVFPGNLSDQKGSMHVRVNHRDRSEKFSLNFSANFLRDHNRLLPQDYTRAAITLAPNAPELYTSEGDLNWENSTWVNPLSELERKYEGFTDNLVSSLVLSYEISRGLTARASFGYTTTRMDEVSTTPLSYYNPAFLNVQSSTVFADASVQSWIIEPQLEYQRAFGDLQFSVLGGGTFQDDHRTGMTLFAQGFPSDALVENILAASSVQVSAVTDIHYRYQAVFGRVGLNWKEKYLLNLTGRRDGSSRFGPSNRFSNFGAFGAGWIFSREPFLSKSKVLSFGKLRTSYGTTGNDKIPDYGYLDSYGATLLPYQDQIGLLPTRLVNPDFGWETNKKFEVALELGWFDDKLFFTTSWYQNRSTRQLVGLPLPLITGQPSVQANFPAVLQNEGIEFDLSTTLFSRDHFTWSLAANVTIPQTILLEYPGIEQSPYANQYQEGESINVRNKLHVTGVNPETGIYEFEDVNGNGIGTDYPADLQFRKEVGYNYYGGLQSKWNYKGWELDVQFQLVNQTAFNYMVMYTIVPGRPGNQPTYVLDRWTESGDNAAVQKYTNSNFSTPAGRAYLAARSNGDITIHDASYVRLKNVSLSYSFPGTWLSKLPLQQAKLYLRGFNVLTFTDYQGLDPENAGLTLLPPLRTITIGGQFTF